MIAETKRVVEAMAEAIRLLKLIDKRKIKYKNTWRHTLGELDGFLNDQIKKTEDKSLKT